MGGLIDLPTEVLTIVLRYVNLHGDLAQMRLVSSSLNMLICEEQHRYLYDILSRYAISDRAMALYNDAHGGTQLASGLRHYLYFRREVAILESLDLRLNELSDPAPGCNQSASLITPLLILSAFAGEFRSNVARTAGTKHPSHSKVPYVLTDTSSYSIGCNWELDVIEALVSATDSCASALWCIDASNDGKEFYVGSDRQRAQSCCTDIAYVGTQQALLTEFVLRNGPIWVARILLSDPNLLQANASGRYRPSHLLSFDALKRTPTNVSADLVAAGMARRIWQLRSFKIEEEQQHRERSKSETLRRTDMRVNSAVWRGSAGDM